MLFALKASSKSKSSSLPVDASSCPTGSPLAPRSDALLLTEKFNTLSEISADSLEDISIKSNVESNLFMLSTTILIPEIYSNSLYFLTVPEL